MCLHLEPEAALICVHLHHTDSLSLAADKIIGKTKKTLPERFHRSNATGTNVGALCTTDSSHLAILEDSDSLSLAAGEICCNKSPVLHHSKFTSRTFGALNINARETFLAKKKNIGENQSWRHRPPPSLSGGKSLEGSCEKI